MKILFLHGWQSTPGGVKPTYLKDHGHEVLNPALPDDDFDAAVRIAQAEFDQHRPDVVVGSSRGGAVAMNINSGTTPLVLLCPAWKRWGTARTVKPGTIILHSKADDVVPFADSQELLRNSGLPESALIVVGSEHRLADPDSLKEMLEACERAGRPEIVAIHQEVKRARYRFGIDTLLIITAMYAVLFGTLRALSFSAEAFVGTAMFFTVVGLGQTLLFRGQRPRRASMIVGCCFSVVLVIINAAVFQSLVLFRSMFVAILGATAIFGALYGCVAGLLISGVFLVLDKLRNVLAKARGRQRTT